MLARGQESLTQGAERALGKEAGSGVVQRSCPSERKGCSASGIIPTSLGPGALIYSSQRTR